MKFKEGDYYYEIYFSDANEFIFVHLEIDGYAIHYHRGDVKNYKTDRYTFKELSSGKPSGALETFKTITRLDINEIFNHNSNCPFYKRVTFEDYNKGIVMKELSQ